MSDDEREVIEVSLARLHERFDAMNERLRRVESIIYVTCGGALVALAYSILTHSLPKIP